MKDKKHSRNMLPSILLILSFLLLIFIGTSLSKFILNKSDNITGGYTDFILEHDAEGKTAILQKENETIYTGYVEFNVYNYRDEKVSARNVIYDLRLPEPQEISNGYVDDGWGNNILINKPKASGEYDVTIESTGGDKTLNENVKESEAVRIKINYTLGQNDDLESLDFSDKISIILETSEPYSSRQVINVDVSNSLLSFNVVSKNYFGFTEETVTINTAADLSPNNDNIFSKVEFSYSGITFDESRFITENSNVELSISNNIITISNIRPSSQLILHFYTSKSSILTVKAFSNQNDTTPYKSVSGLGKCDANGVYVVYSNVAVYGNV